jgi:alpha-N-arabinofuranosidase
MGTDNPSFIARRQQHQKGEASTALSFTPAAENEKSGLLIFQNEDHFYFLCQSMEGGKEVVQLYSSIRDKNDAVDMELLASQPVTLSAGKDLLLKILIQADTYAFAFSTDGEVWQTLMESVDARLLSTATTGGFVGCTIGPYASSHGKESASKALFRWFEYKGNDDIYKQKQP